MHISHKYLSKCLWYSVRIGEKSKIVWQCLCLTTIMTWLVLLSSFESVCECHHGKMHSYYVTTAEAALNTLRVMPMNRFCQCDSVTTTRCSHETVLVWCWNQNTVTQEWAFSLNETTEVVEEVKCHNAKHGDLSIPLLCQPLQPHCVYTLTKYCNLNFPFSWHIK